MSVFKMEPNDYPHLYLTEDGRLRSMGLHCPRFVGVLYDALIRPSYDGDALVYHCQMYRVHDLDRYEVSVMIPLYPTNAWLGFVVSSKPNTSVEMMAHITLISLCGDHLIATMHCISRFS
jgi:hypothetical protein